MLPCLCMTFGCLLGCVINDRVSARHGLYWGRSGLGILSFVLTGLFLAGGSMVDNAPLAVLILAGGAGALYLSQSSFWSVTPDIAGPHRSEELRVGQECVRQCRCRGSPYKEKKTYW